jgi:opacity protein-like surface antigen
MKKNIQLAIFSLFLFSSIQMFSQEINAEKKSDSISNIKLKHPLLSNKFTFVVGAYSSFKTMKIGVNGTNQNDIIDFNEKFNFNDNEITPFFYFNWRFLKNWSLSAEYFGIKNVNSATFNENIEWEDYVFNAGLSIKAGFKVNMYRIMFGRTISKGLKHELGAGLGFHALETEVFLEGQAYINEEITGEGADTEFKRSVVNVVAPLPNIGAWYFYAPTDKWMFNARLDWLGIKIGDYTGSMWNFAAGANYQFHKNIGVGLKYRYFDFTATVDNEKWDGKLDLIFHGPLLTINANF